MNFKYDDTYFFKLVEWIMEAEPGKYKIDSLTRDVERFKHHITWYNQCRPKEFNGVNFINDTEFEITKHEK